MSPNLLVPYDVNRELVLNCDASECGLGAVLSHRMKDGSERPIRYASRTYRQRLQPARVQRWALTLSGYQYSIVPRPGDQMGKLPRTSRHRNCRNSFTHGATKFVTCDSYTHPRMDIPRSRAIQDPQVCPAGMAGSELFLQQAKGGNQMGVFYVVRESLYHDNYAQTFCKIHESHPGISGMKSFARSYVWWPGLDKDLENKVCQCLLCQSARIKSTKNTDSNLGVAKAAMDPTTRAPRGSCRKETTVHHC